MTLAFQSSSWLEAPVFSALLGRSLGLSVSGFPDLLRVFGHLGLPKKSYRLSAVRVGGFRDA